MHDNEWFPRYLRVAKTVINRLAEPFSKLGRRAGFLLHFDRNPERAGQKALYYHHAT